METIEILCTGGTFEKVYGRGAGIHDFSFPEVSIVESIAKRFGVANVAVTYDVNKAKDSLDMTDEDREDIVVWCQSKETSPKIIIHGSDSLVLSAQTVEKQEVAGVTIFTAASQPAAMKDSDAEFNLGGAIIAAQILTPGVYIVMNGQVFTANNCRKNPDSGVFEEIH